MFATVLISVVVSAIVSKIVAAYQFEVIDGYVKDMIEMAKREIANAYFNRNKQ